MKRVNQECLKQVHQKNRIHVHRHRNLHRSENIQQKIFHSMFFSIVRKQNLNIVQRSNKFGLFKMSTKLFH